MTLPVIGFAGMTHLGVNSAAATMARGFRIVGWDEDAAVVAGLRSGRAPVVEPGLEDLLCAHASQSTFSTEPAALGQCDVVYLSVDVATDDEGRSDLGRVERTIRAAAGAMNANAVLVVLCQVPPGFTRGLDIPRSRLFYQVETLVFGRAVDRALNPERFILGCDDPARPLPESLGKYLAAFACPLLPMRYESAELAKIAINCCLVASISVANTLAELCEQIGAAWSEIAPALKLDKRIGQHSYLSPGLGIAGGNLERDLATVIRFAEQLGTDAGVVRAWVANSRHRRGWAARTIRRVLLDASPDAPLAIWGLAYKENTHSTKNSPALATIAALPGAILRLHDPVVPASAADHAGAVGCAGPLDAVRGADALMILTPWPQYRDIDPVDVATAMRGRIVLDPYSVFDPRRAAAAGLEVHTLGRAPMNDHHA